MQRLRASAVTAAAGMILAIIPSVHAAPDEVGLSAGRRTEAALLNRRVDMGGLVQRQRAPAGWRKLTLPAAPVTVLNLWSLSCKPCLEELPALGQVMRQYPGVPFLYIADPPTESSRDEITRFWDRPIVQLLPDRCSSITGEVPARGGENACRLFLPPTEPARSEDARLSTSLASATLRPITVLLDRNGVVRQAFVGSLVTRVDELGRAIERLRDIQATEGAASVHRRR